MAKKRKKYVQKLDFPELQSEVKSDKEFEQMIAEVEAGLDKIEDVVIREASRNLTFQSLKAKLNLAKSLSNDC